MSRNIRIHELSNLKDFSIIIATLAYLSDEKEVITKKQIIKKTKFSDDKITESLHLLNLFGLLRYYRNSEITITQYGRSFIDTFSEKTCNFSSENSLYLSSLYRKIPLIAQTIDLFLIRKRKEITSFNFDYFLKANEMKDIKWILRHLKGLSIIEYSNYKNAKLTETGRRLFEIFFLERALQIFGRDLFKSKLGMNESQETLIKDFLTENKAIFEISYPETQTIFSLLNNQLLTGGIELLDHEAVIDYRNYIKNYYEPNRKSRIALFLPCAKGKPFSSSRTHKRVNKALNGLIDENKKCKNLDGIEEFIISEPIGVIPRKYEMIYPSASYDMTLDAWIPLDTLNTNNNLDDTSQFFSSITKIRQKSSETKKEKDLIIESISDEVYKFFIKHSSHFNYFVAYMRSTHKLMVEKAAKKAGIDVIYVPNNEEMNKLREDSGSVSWSLRGLRNTKTLIVLLERLNSLKS